jgi:hypothetical protein
MRERLVSLLLALAALAAFYGLWLRPSSAFDPDADVARPTTAERRGNGYAGLFDWLQRSHVHARSFRERYTALAELDITPRGNLLVLTLPAVDTFRHEEFSALDRWVRKGNTLMIVAALIDQPGWGARRSSGAVAEIESLTGLEFEDAESRAQRLDDTPLSQRVRENDEREAREEAGEATEEEARRAEPREEPGALDVPEDILLTATGPHALLREVSQLQLESDYGGPGGGDWSLRIPYDGFVLTLARTATGEGALFEQRLGAGHVIVSAGGSLFTNRALGSADNARLFANVVRERVADNGTVLFDDLRQGLSASYNPARFYRDPRLYKTLIVLLGLWLAWVVGATRLRAPVLVEHDPSEADLVRHAGGLIARTVASHQAARRLFDGFFSGVARAVRGATGSLQPERGELWQWLERHAAVRPQELDQLKTWYADAHAERKVPLVPLQNLLDTLGKRLNT